MASAQEKLQAAIDSWIGDSEERKAYLQANPEAVKQFLSEAVTSASPAKQAKAAQRAAEGVGLGDYLSKGYTEWRSSPEQVEAKQQEYLQQIKDILGGYMGREGMADEKDVAAYREAANRGVEKPEAFSYDMDAAIARFQNPNLQAAIDRGTAAIERSATARGMNDGSDLRKAIADYATSKASEDYQKAAQLAEADKQSELEAWRSKAQLGQQADTTGLSALQILAGYGNANVGNTAQTDVGITKGAFDDTETAYQTRYEQNVAQEQFDKQLKAAQEQADKQMYASIFGGLTGLASSALNGGKKGGAIA